MVIHTADKLLVRDGAAYYCKKPPILENKNVFWSSDIILYRDEKLWLVANETESDKSQSSQMELFELDVKREEPQIKMNGTIRCIGDPAGEHASGPTEMIRIDNRPRWDAAQEAYRIFGLS